MLLFGAQIAELKVGWRFRTPLLRLPVLHLDHAAALVVGRAQEDLVTIDHRRGRIDGVGGLRGMGKH